MAPRRTIRVQPGIQRRFVAVAEEFIDLYAPLIGPEAVAAWLVLRLAADRGEAIADAEPAEFVARALGLEVLRAAEALRQLLLYELVEPDREGELLVKEPLPRRAFERRFGSATVRRAQAGGGTDEGGAAADGTASPAHDEVAAAGERVEEQEPAAADQGKEGRAAAARMQSEELPKDVRGVLDWYHQRIGLISESQFERLCEWITRRGMTADVVALAIEETARSAQYASFSYLEGVLRNWYNQGVRTWQDLNRRRHLSAVLGQAAASQRPGAKPAGPAPTGPGLGEEARADRPERGQAERGHPLADAPMEGVPNAEAYRPVDPERVKRWKEMYARGR